MNRCVFADGSPIDELGLWYHGGLRWALTQSMADVDPASWGATDIEVERRFTDRRRCRR
jgi:hypothetical protein